MRELSKVIAALEAGLDAAPEDSALRLQLARVLLNDGEPERALAEYARVLALDPLAEDALRGARDAAMALGDEQRASAYARILESLGAEPRDTAVPAEPDCHD